MTAVSRALTNSAAQVSAKRYRYTGKEKDEETGLYYHGARYYAPWLGRWTAVDPIGIGGGLNLYRYSRDNPIMFSDPGGTAPFAKPGSNDYKVGTSTDPELIGYLKGLSPEQRGDFVAGATGKFQARTQAALKAANLGVTFTVTGTQSEATAPSNSEETGGQPVTSPPLQRTEDDPVVAGCAGSECYLNIRESRLLELQRQARVNRSLQTLGNVANGILGAVGYLIGKASSDDPDVQGAASDIGALGDNALQAVGTVEQITPRQSTRAAEPTRSLAAEPKDRGLSEARVDLLRTLGERQRTLELSQDLGDSGIRVAEGIAGVRIERATGRPVARGTHKGIDLTGGGLGNISLKGPLRARSGDPVPITDAMVRGLASSVIYGANNTAVDVVVVDTLGLTKAQTELLIGLIAAEGPTRKPITFLR